MRSKRRNNGARLHHSELTFYIKLYCDRKKSKESKYRNNLVEAIKSYLSLTDAEKQKISEKFQECEAQERRLISEHLKSAKPYFKAKKLSQVNNCSSPKNIDGDDNDLTTNNIESNEIREETQDLDRIQTVSPTIEENNENDFTNEKPALEESTTNEIEEDQNNLEVDQEKQEEPQNTFLIEPIPPSIKTGYELFCLLNSTEDNNNTSWASLQRLEKNRYSRAVTLLKKDYISKYKEYLESLSPEDLFDHYHKTMH